MRVGASTAQRLYSTVRGLIYYCILIADGEQSIFYYIHSLVHLINVLNKSKFQIWRHRVNSIIQAKCLAGVMRSGREAWNC